MSGNRDIGGVGLAFVGFAIIVLGFKGTWSKVWRDLWSSASSSDPAGSGGSSATSGPWGQSGGGTVTHGPGGTWVVPADPNAPSYRQVQPAGYAPRLPNTFVATPSGVLT